MTTVRSIFDRFVRWLVLSSANPVEVGMTAKAGMIAALPTILLIAGVAHWNLGSDQLNVLFDNSVTIIEDVLYLVAAIVGTIGFIRKLVNTANGTNTVNLVPLAVSPAVPSVTVSLPGQPGAPSAPSAPEVAPVAPTAPVDVPSTAGVAR